jgi:ATP-binding cassette subfamily B (MDR/TAP) protein 1
MVNSSDGRFVTWADLNLHRLFIIAIIATMSIGMQNYLFSSAAARLTSKLRSLSFKAILRQDSTEPISLWLPLY